MKKLTMTLAVLTCLQAYAFNTVTEILPSGKLLICKEPNQVRNGDVVEVQKRADPKSLSDDRVVKVSEFKLPAPGQKIKLIHKDFHPAGKNSKYHTEELGSAVISGDSLEGEERMISTLDNTRRAKRIEKKIVLTKEAAETLQKNCLVALPENGLKVEENAAVSW